MLNLKSYTDFAGELIKFVDRIKTYDISFEDMLKLDEITPIKEDLDIISSWWNGSIQKSEPATELKPETIETTSVEPQKVENPVEKKEKRPNRTGIKMHRITKDRAKAISEYIALKHNGDTVHDAVQDSTKEFKENIKTMQRLVDKTSFSEISDEYFSIKDNVIVSKIETMKNIFGSTKSDIELIKELIKDAKYNVISAITDDMTASDITKLAMVRLKMYQTGETDSIGGGVKEILLMNEITNNKKANINTIMNIMKTKYNVDVDPELVSAVKTGRSHKEIFARF
jgi:uncharacterized protein YjaG (DUF416 family)